MPANPLISIIIPVLNEAAIINATINYLTDLASGTNVEIVVIDGDPLASTIKHVRNPVVKKVVAPKGRGAQMNAGVRKSRGDILIFLHVDTLLPPMALESVLTVWGQPNYVGGAFDLGIRGNRSYYRLVEQMVYWRSRITNIPYGDQAIFLRRSYFEAIGGYCDIPIMEDVEIMQRVKRRNGKIKIIPLKVLTSARRWEKEGMLFCTLRNWILVVLYHFGVTPNRLARFYKFNTAK